MTHAYLQGLVDRRLSAWEQAKDLLDGAAQEKRELSGEETAAWEKINADMDTLDGEIRDKTAALIGGFKRPYHFTITHQSDISERSRGMRPLGTPLAACTAFQRRNVLKSRVFYKQRAHS